MNAGMYSLLILAFVMANAPFLTNKGLGIITLKRKTILHHLLELVLGWVLLGGLSYVLERRTGTVHTQGWEFYAVVICLYLVLAFPAFVWRYFWHGRNKE